MLPDRTDPERRMATDERVATAISQFERRAISEDVFRATLFGVGIVGRAADDLVWLHRPMPSLAQISAPVLGKFVSGLS